MPEIVNYLKVQLVSVFCGSHTFTPLLVCVGIDAEGRHWRFFEKTVFDLESPGKNIPWKTGFEELKREADDAYHPA